MFQVFGAKLVLEVFGGGGAIWGFSEVLTLRNEHTVWFWRPCATAVGAIFFCRWVLQMKDYMVEHKLVQEEDGFGEQPASIQSDQHLSHNSGISDISGLEVPATPSAAPSGVSMSDESTPLFSADEGYIV